MCNKEGGTVVGRRGGGADIKNKPFVHVFKLET